MAITSVRGGVLSWQEGREKEDEKGVGGVKKMLKKRR